MSRKSFAAAFEQRRAHPGFATAIVVYTEHGDRVHKTFFEFDYDVQAVRGLLREQMAEARILATLAGNTYNHLVFLTAALLEKCTLCPINPAENDSAIARKLKQLGEPCVVAVSRARGFSPQNHKCIFLEVPLSGDVPLACPMPFPASQPMVLIFTSGSTGFSKIVEQTELAILSNVEALIERHALPAIIGTPLPLFHVNALEFSFFATLLSGGTLVLFERLDLKQIADAIEREKIDILSVVPHILTAFINRLPGLQLEKLKYIVTAAAPLGADLAKKILRSFPVRVLQGYGLSEAVNFSTLMPAAISTAEYTHWMTGFKHPSIGTELNGNSLHIVAANGLELGEKETGEICVRGLNVMSGYKNDPDRAIFSGEWLHTGDLGHFVLAPDGQKFFFVSGRIKDVIKRNATTISLGEVDQAVGSLHPHIIAVGFKNGVAGEELALVVQSSVKPSREWVSQLEKYLESTLANFNRPRVLAWTRHEVRTASGKPQRWKFAPAFPTLENRILPLSLLFLEEPVESNELAVINSWDSVPL